MAKGTGWAMAEVMGSLKVAHLQGQYRVCPICGAPMAPGFMTEQFKCNTEWAADMPEWLKTALREQGYKPWAFYPQNGAISVLATAENGVELCPMRDRGNFGGWQWNGIPEGEITFLDWFPIEARDEYIAQRWAAWEEELITLLEHPDVSISDDELENEHPATLIGQAKRQIEVAEKTRQKKAEREVQRQADQADLDKALADDGFFRGRKGKAEIPEGATVIWRTSHGDRQNPIQTIVGPHLTVDQLQALVAAAGDYSEVRMHGQFPVVHTPDPARWIGRKGCIAKALAKALGIKFLKVVEKK